MLLGELPTTAPTPTPSDNPENNKQDDCAEGRIDDEGDRSCAEMDTQCRQQPISNERADDADYEVADEAVAAAPHDRAGQPAGDNADQDDNYETFDLSGSWRFLPGILYLSQASAVPSRKIA